MIFSIYLIAKKYSTFKVDIEKKLNSNGYIYSGLKMQKFKIFMKNNHL